MGVRQSQVLPSPLLLSSSVTLGGPPCSVKSLGHWSYREGSHPTWLLGRLNEVTLLRALPEPGLEEALTKWRLFQSGAQGGLRGHLGTQEAH